MNFWNWFAQVARLDAYVNCSFKILGDVALAFVRSNIICATTGIDNFGNKNIQSCFTGLVFNQYFKMHGFTLHPDSHYTKARLRVSLPQPGFLPSHRHWHVE